MRLIDADAFKENVVKYSHQSLKTIGLALDETPTVDAVPVEWIKNYIKHTENNGNTFAAVQYEMMLWDYLADGERNG